MYQKKRLITKYASAARAQKKNRMFKYLFKKKDLHSSSTLSLSHLAGRYLVPNLGIRWQLETIESSGIISEIGRLLREVRETGKRPESEWGARKGVNQSM